MFCVHFRIIYEMFLPFIDATRILPFCTGIWFILFFYYFIFFCRIQYQNVTVFSFLSFCSCKMLPVIYKFMKCFSVFTEKHFIHATHVCSIFYKRFPFINLTFCMQFLMIFFLSLLFYDKKAKALLDTKRNCLFIFVIIFFFILSLILLVWWKIVFRLFSVICTFIFICICIYFVCLKVDHIIIIKYIFL